MSLRHCQMHDCMAVVGKQSHSTLAWGRSTLEGGNRETTAGPSRINMTGVDDCGGKALTGAMSVQRGLVPGISMANSNGDEGGRTVSGRTTPSRNLTSFALCSPSEPYHAGPSIVEMPSHRVKWRARDVQMRPPALLHLSLRGGVAAKLEAPVDIADVVAGQLASEVADAAANRFFNALPLELF